jgi:Proteobacterial lipase chaperone protein
MLHRRSRTVSWRIVAPALLAGLGAVGLYAWQHDASSPEAVQASKTFPWARTPGSPAVAEAVPSRTDPMLEAPTGAGGSGPSDAPGRGRPFRVDAQGRLVIDQTMRLELESLLALHQGAEQAAALDAQLAGLPAAAATRARELMGQYQSYQEAQRQSFPPGQAPLLPEEGLAQLKSLQALRATYLGAEPARDMFAQDDAVAQRLLELMREDSSTTLTMAEKAVRAQARYDTERNRVQP